MEVEAAVEQFRARCAAAPLVTYEYRTLPIKDTRAVLSRTFGETSRDGGAEVIAGWSLCPWPTRPRCESHSRVGMVKAGGALPRLRATPKFGRNVCREKSHGAKNRPRLLAEDPTPSCETLAEVRHSATGSERGPSGIGRHAVGRGQGKRRIGTLRNG